MSLITYFRTNQLLVKLYMCLHNFRLIITSYTFIQVSMYVNFLTPHPPHSCMYTLLYRNIVFCNFWLNNWLVFTFGVFYSLSRCTSSVRRHWNTPPRYSCTTGSAPIAGHPSEPLPVSASPPNNLAGCLYFCNVLSICHVCLFHL